LEKSGDEVNNPGECKKFLDKGFFGALKRLLISSWWHTCGHDGTCRSREHFRDVLLHSRLVKAVK